MIPPYPKVLTVGTRGTERLFEGPVIIQEKVDGSQFRFGLAPNGDLEFASHHQQVFPGSAGMFEPVVQYLLERENTIRSCLEASSYLCGEYLARPRQNTLVYARRPNGYLVLFDILDPGGFGHYPLSDIGKALDCEVVPTLFEGRTTLSDARSLLNGESFLGGTTVEGIVIKNYHENIRLGSQVFPLFCKLVNGSFKEKHARNPDWKSGKSKETEYYESFRTEARWRKAIQHLRERGELEDSPRDIGKIMKEIHDDLVAEEGDDIREWLYKHHIKDLVRTVQRGLPEWYKDLLARAIDA